MRLRLRELMQSARMETAYQLAKASGGRISMTNAQRLVNTRPKRIDFDTLDALCDVFNVGPGELLEREKKRR